MKILNFLKIKECQSCHNFPSLGEEITLSCNHVYCLDCLRTYCLSQGKSQENFKICPLCKEPFSKDEETMYFLLQLILAEKLEEFDKSIAANRCINCPNCKSPFEKIKLKNLKCPYCEVEICPNCYEIKHNVETLCQQKRLLFLQANKGNDFCNICPLCFHFAYKDENCNKVICRNPECRLEFCFKCSVEMSPIYQHGNHYHRPDCALFSAIDNAVANGKFKDIFSLNCTKCVKKNALCNKPISYESFCKTNLGISLADFNQFIRGKFERK